MPYSGAIDESLAGDFSECTKLLEATAEFEVGDHRWKRTEKGGLCRIGNASRLTTVNSSDSEEQQVRGL